MIIEAKTIANVQYPKIHIHWKILKFTPKNCEFKLTINPPIHIIPNIIIKTIPVFSSRFCQDKTNPRTKHNNKGPQKSQSCNDFELPDFIGNKATFIF